MWKETINMPVSYKRWFIERIVKEINKGSDEGHNTSKAIHQNTPEVHSLQGMARSQVPSRLRRFT